MIDDWNSDIIDFDPVPHTYTNRRTKQRYLGVTSFIGQFEPEFPAEMASGREALKRFWGERSYKYTSLGRLLREKKKDSEKLILVDYAIARTGKEPEIRIIQKQVLKEWKDKNTKSIIKGHSFHSKQEDKANFNGFSAMRQSMRKVADVSNWPRSANGKINLADKLPDGLHTEIIVSNHEYRLSGQIDRSYIETINGVRYLDIDDWKTNEVLTSESKYNQTFNAPLDFLPFHKLHIYKIQILLYAWIAQQHGFVPRNLSITHCPNTWSIPEVLEILPFRSDQDPIKIMLNVRKNQIKSLKL